MTDKLTRLMDIQGYNSPDQLFEDESFFISNAIAGICSAPNCDYTTTVEPCQDHGFCKWCGTYTVQSALVVANLCRGAGSTLGSFYDGK